MGKVPEEGEGTPSEGVLGRSICSCGDITSGLFCDGTSTRGTRPYKINKVKQRS